MFKFVDCKPQRFTVQTTGWGQGGQLFFLRPKMANFAAKSGERTPNTNLLLSYDNLTMYMLGRNRVGSQFVATGRCGVSYVNTRQWPVVKKKYSKVFTNA